MIRRFVRYVLINLLWGIPISFGIGFLIWFFLGVMFNVDWATHFLYTWKWTYIWCQIIAVVVDTTNKLGKVANDWEY
ncbi:hypothetical protein KAZ57_02200 [Patescibacteria group bacterium]|nr:hypothetical protein [Patescibacteria group bacterium]